MSALPLALVISLALVIVLTLGTVAELVSYSFLFFVSLLCAIIVEFISILHQCNQYIHTYEDGRQTRSASFTRLKKSMETNGLK